MVHTIVSIFERIDQNVRNVLEQLESMQKAEPEVPTTIDCYRETIQENVKSIRDGLTKSLNALNQASVIAKNMEEANMTIRNLQRQWGQRHVYYRRKIEKVQRLFAPIRVAVSAFIEKASLSEEIDDKENQTQWIGHIQFGQQRLTYLDIYEIAMQKLQSLRDETPWYEMNIATTGRQKSDDLNGSGSSSTPYSHYSGMLDENPTDLLDLQQTTLTQEVGSSLSCGFILSKGRCDDSSYSRTSQDICKFQLQSSEFNNMSLSGKEYQIKEICRKFQSKPNRIGKHVSNEDIKRIIKFRNNDTAQNLDGPLLPFGKQTVLQKLKQENISADRESFSKLQRSFDEIFDGKANSPIIGHDTLFIYGVSDPLSNHDQLEAELPQIQQDLSNINDASFPKDIRNFGVDDSYSEFWIQNKNSEIKQDESTRQDVLSLNLDLQGQVI